MPTLRLFVTSASVSLVMPPPAGAIFANIVAKASPINENCTTMLEHPSEYPNRGGLGVYVRRMARALHEAGHDPEVFTPTRGPSDSIVYDGTKLHLVNWRKDNPGLRLLFGGSRRILRARFWSEPGEWVLQSNSLAAALEQTTSSNPSNWYIALII